MTQEANKTILPQGPLERTTGDKPDALDLALTAFTGEDDCLFRGDLRGAMYRAIHTYIDACSIDGPCCDNGTMDAAHDCQKQPGTEQSFVSPAVLREHWLTGIECDEAARTDTATCFCATWRSEPKATVAEAVDAWIEHVFGAEHDREVPECVEIGPDGRAYVIGLPGDDHNCDSMRCPSASAHTLYVLPVEPAEQAKSDISAHTMAAIFDAFKTEMLIGFDSFREFEEQAGEIRTEALRRRIGAALNG